MRKAFWAYGILAAASIAASAPAAAQTVQIGRDGVKIIPTEQMRDRRDDRDRYDNRRGDDRRDRQERRQVRESVSERDAIRIARRQGVRDVGSVTKTRSTYRVAGIDRRGHRIRVDIDRDSGSVIRVR